MPDQLMKARPNGGLFLPDHSAQLRFFGLIIAQIIGQFHLHVSVLPSW
jgi:hypothetical protein